MKSQPCHPGKYHGGANQSSYAGSLFASVQTQADIQQGREEEQCSQLQCISQNSYNHSHNLPPLFL
jgi:hypothetical protein